MHLCLALGARSAGLSGREVFLALRRSPGLGRAVELQQRLCHSLRYDMGYAGTTGRRYSFGADGQENSIRTLQKSKHTERLRRQAERG